MVGEKEKKRLEASFPNTTKRPNKTTNIHKNQPAHQKTLRKSEEIKSSWKDEKSHLELSETVLTVSIFEQFPRRHVLYMYSWLECLVSVFQGPFMSGSGEARMPTSPFLPLRPVGCDQLFGSSVWRRLSGPSIEGGKGCFSRLGTVLFDTGILAAVDSIHLF